MSLVFAALVPHPPIIVPEIGKEALAKCKATRDGLMQLARSLKAAKPDALFLITPHGPAFRDTISVISLPSFKGTFSRFGQPEVAIEVKGETQLTNRILEMAEARKIPVVPLDEATLQKFGIPDELDHAAMVPLYYFKEAGLDVPLALASIGFVSYSDHFNFGECVREAIELSDKRIAFIASGDLSHRLMPEAPAGYDPEGKVFDAKIMTLLKEKQFEDVVNLNEGLIRRAGECGFRPIVTLLGAIHDRKTNPSVISYEGPFGVGYGVIDFGIA